MLQGQLPSDKAQMGGRAVGSIMPLSCVVVEVCGAGGEGCSGDADVVMW